MPRFDCEDISPEFVLEDSWSDRFVIIEKVGGGTIGREYTGWWKCFVVDSHTRQEVYRGQYKSGVLQSHKEAAEGVLWFVDGFDACHECGFLISHKMDCSAWRAE